MTEGEFHGYYQVDGNQHRPTVELNAKTGVLKLEGRSILENTVLFYEPVLKWIDNYIESPAKNTEFHMMLEYFNTSSSKFLMNIIDKLGNIKKNGGDVTVLWHYADEDMEELGIDYKNIMSVPFIFIELDN